MQVCRLPLRLAALAAALVSLAHATTVIAPDFDKMVGSADYIVRAVVKSVTPEWRDNPKRPGQRYIASRVELDVREVIKGTPPQPLVLDLVGGRIGDVELEIDGAPKFAPGEESVLFIRGNGRLIVPLVGIMHGHYPVRRDAKTGRDEILRHNGQALYNEQEVALPESAVSAAATDPKVRPLTAAEFSARIRRSPKYYSRERFE